MTASPRVADDLDDLRGVSQIGTGLARLSRLWERTAVTPGEDLDRASFMLLNTLACTGPSRVTTLAATVHSDPSTVSRQTAHLVSMGLVARHADPGDGRASLLALTDTGAALLEHTRQRRDDRIAAITRSWLPAEREQFANLIDRFTAGYEAHWCAERSDSTRN